MESGLSVVQGDGDSEVNFFANGIGVSYDGGHEVGTDSLRRISLVC
jgi:hypothetical protein